MTIFLILLALIIVLGIGWTLVVVARDGYRRSPDRYPDGPSSIAWH